MDPCLTEDAIAAMVEGSLDGAAFTLAERHISACARCMRLVEEAGAALANTDAEVEVTGGPKAPSLARGTKVGRYEVESLLGSGGMGRVYLAIDPALDRKVALKLLHPHSATPELEARLLREAKAMARLVHPSVIAVHDAGHHDGGQLFIAMEFVDGGTLRQWLAMRPRTWQETLDLLLRAGRGLARAHEAGIVHRDFKPDNVLVSNDGRVLVSDFGLARTGPGEEISDEGAGGADAVVEGALTRTGTVLGTPAYMAPEQHARAPADVRSDIYSFCVTAYEALSGGRPFTAGTLQALSTQKAEGMVADPPSFRGAPSALRKAILRGLRPRPEERYASMEALLSALETAARRPRRPRRRTLGLGLGVLGAAALLGVVVRHRSKTDAQAPRAAVAPLGCASDSACVATHGGAPYVCSRVAHECVAVASEDCVPSFEPGDRTRDDTVWIGAMFPSSGDGTMQSETVAFARGEIAQATRAFDGLGAAHPVRKIAFVVCDEGADPKRAGRHLVEIGVPAVVGFGTGQGLIDLAGSLFIGMDVLSIATMTANPLVTRLPQPAFRPRMVWRTTYNFDAVADVSARVIEELLAPRYAGAEMRVTVLRTEVPGAVSFAQRLFGTLRFNGRSALENGSAYAELSVPPGALSAGEVARIAERAADTEPSVVVLQGDPSTTVPVVQRIEERMAHAKRKPAYVAALYQLDVFSPLLLAHPDLRRRLYSIQSSSNSPLNAHFVIRYNQTHDRKVTRTMNGGATYDAVYLLAYSIFTLPPGPVTGPAIGRGFTRLLGPGPAVEVGPTGIFDALSVLQQGGTIDLIGVDSELNFDTATGDEPTDFELLCSDVDAQGRATGADRESGISFESKTRRLRGQLACP